MTMFPHTVTVYNTSEDPVTFETVDHITVLQGVFYDASKAVNVQESGLANADSVGLIVPFGVEAVDGETGEPQTYLSPKEYDVAVDKGKHWTVKTGNECFFVKGEVVRPGLSFQEINAAFDNVHRVTSVDEKDFGGLRHWEIGGA